MSLPRRSNSLIGLNERDILTRIKIINSFKMNEEAFLNKYYCDRDTLFNICLPSFKKLLRERSEIKFISLYLANLKKFITLLKNINEDNTNNATQKQNNNKKDQYLKLLRYVSEHILYESFASKRLVMRYGELGSRLYIILHGVVSILIPVKVPLQMTFIEFSKYIANLLLYREFELARITLRENKHVYRIDLPDMKHIINYFNKKNDENEETFIPKNQIQNNFNLLKGIKSERTIHATKIVHKMSKYFKDTNNSSNIQEDKSIEEDKAFEAEYAQKIEKFMNMCLSKEQLKLFEEVKKQNNELEKDDGVELSVETYINRLKIYKSNLDLNTNTNNKPERLKRRNLSTRRQIRSKTSKLNHDKENGAQERYYLSKNKNAVYIYEYQEIIQLETGDMFGDTALGSLTSKRTATIISSSDCHFGCLNKEVYNYIKFSNDKTRKNNINYICRTRIFKNLKYKTMEEKYINYFAFKTCVKDEYLLKFGDVNNNIIIIKNGKFEINIKGSIKNIFEIINEYNKNFIQFNELGLGDNLIRKIIKLNSNRNKIERLFGPKNLKSLNDTIYKIFMINSSSIFGFKENEKKQRDNYISFFEIKCVSSEGEYVLLDKRIFYRQMYAIDYKVKEETHTYIKEFTDKTIHRLIHILYSKIYHLLTRNNMKKWRRMKISSGMTENNKSGEKEINCLRNEIKLDYEYMNRYDLTDIEYIIDKIMNKYTEEDFDDENINVRIYSDNEEKEMSQKNTIKLGEEKKNISKTNSLLKNLRHLNKMNTNKLTNFKKNNKLQLNRNYNLINGRKVSNADKIQKLFNYYSDNKNNHNISDIRNSKRKSYSFSEEKKSSLVSENKLKNKRKFNIILSNNNFNSINSNFSSYNFDNCNNSNKNVSLCILGRTSDSYMSDVNISCNYVNYGNACISKLNFNFNFKKNLSMGNFETSKSNKKFKIDKYVDAKMNQILGKEEKIKNEFDGFFSAKIRSNSYLNIFGSTEKNKEKYSERRKKYVLKCVRDIWTRNSPIVFYKRKKKCDKKV